MKNNRKAFTLIELLIVIALLGALAVALLAALDPLEQIKKGTDTGVRNTVAEISSSFTRYASVKSGDMPYTGFIDWGTIGTTAGNAAYDAIAAVVTTGELKTDFLSLAHDQLNKIYVIADQTRSYVCFEPSAKAFKSDNNTKFIPPALGGSVATMSEDTTCTAGTNGSGSVCYWCVR
jgi:prepilin-type N-terminal cleavage/methylation domain-containing protein